MSAVIAFKGLTKKFGAVTALDDPTAEVAPGRSTAFLGPNGSGNTTSMRLLLGLDPDGIITMRRFLRGFADQGRSVFAQLTARAASRT